MAVSEGTKRSVDEVGVDPSKVDRRPERRCAPTRSASAEEGRARVRDELGIPDDAFVVGCISRFHPKKRNDVVVDAVIALRRPARAPDPRRRRRDRGGAARAGRAARRPRRTSSRRPADDVADVLSAFDVSVFCPSPTEGAPRAVILGMLARASVPVDRRRGRRRHDHAARSAASPSPENDPESLRALLVRYLDDPARVDARGRRRAGARREHLRGARRRGADRGPVRRGDRRERRATRLAGAVGAL